jgi:hypothetical protein
MVTQPAIVSLGVALRRRHGLLLISILIAFEPFLKS